jgi:hypothetical protein
LIHRQSSRISDSSIPAPLSSSNYEPQELTTFDAQKVVYVKANKPTSTMSTPSSGLPPPPKVSPEKATKLRAQAQATTQARIAEAAANLQASIDKAGAPIPAAVDPVQQLVEALKLVLNERDQQAPLPFALSPALAQTCKNH